jgi:hypothetical protein
VMPACLSAHYPNPASSFYSQKGMAGNTFSSFDDSRRV